MLRESTWPERPDSVALRRSRTGSRTRPPAASPKPRRRRVSARTWSATGRHGTAGRPTTSSPAFELGRPRSRTGASGRCPRRNYASSTRCGRAPTRSSSAAGRRMRAAGWPVAARCPWASTSPTPSSRAHACSSSSSARDFRSFARVPTTFPSTTRASTSRCPSTGRARGSTPSAGSRRRRGYSGPAGS